jgi:hypothetical protein
MTTPSAPPFEAVARRFALGELDGATRLAVEERIVVDEEAHETLMLVADDLAEDYLDGALTDAERQGFEQHYLAIYEHRAQLRLLEALRSRSTAPASTPGPVPVPMPVPMPVSKPWWQRAPLVGTVTRACREYPQWAAAALVALMAWGAGSTWLILRPVPATAENVARPPTVPEPRRQPTPQPASGQVGGPSVAALREQFFTHAARVAALATTPPEVALRSGLERSGGSMPRLAVPRDAVIVRLRIEIPSTPGLAAYRAAILDQDGGQVYEVALPRVGPATKVASVLVPTAYLPRGDYRAVVTASAADGTPQRVAAFPFRVIPDISTER